MVTSYHRRGLDILVSAQPAEVWNRPPVDAITRLPLAERPGDFGSVKTSFAFPATAGSLQTGLPTASVVVAGDIRGES